MNVVSMHDVSMSCERCVNAVHVLYQWYISVSSMFIIFVQILYRYCDNVLPIFSTLSKCCVNVVSMSCQYLSMSCQCFIDVVSIFYQCCVIVVSILCHCCASLVPLLCQPSATVMFVLCQCFTNIIHIKKNFLERGHCLICILRKKKNREGFRVAEFSLKILFKVYSEKFLLYNISIASFAFISSLIALSTCLWIFTLEVTLAFFNGALIPCGVITWSLFLPTFNLFFNAFLFSMLGIWILTEKYSTSKNYDPNSIQPEFNCEVQYKNDFLYLCTFKFFLE